MKKMTKKEFTSILLETGVEYATVVSFADMEDGRQNFIFFRKVTHEDLADRDDCPHTEWAGDVTDIVRERNVTFVDSYEMFHESRKEYKVTLEELVLQKLQRDSMED